MTNSPTAKPNNTNHKGTNPIMNKTVTILTAIAAVLLITATPASAHVPQVTPSCTGLAVNLTQYESSSPNNRVTITIDNTVTVVDFGGSYSNTYPWSDTAGHVWSVVIDANRTNGGNPTGYDKTFSGTQQACRVPPTTTTTTVAPTTTVPVTTTTNPEHQPPTTVPAAITTTVPAATDPTTTTTVAELIPPTTVGTPPVPTILVADDLAAQQLPNTGNDWLGVLVFIAAVLVTTGLVVRRSAR